MSARPLCSEFLSFLLPRCPGTVRASAQSRAVVSPVFPEAALLGTVVTLKNNCCFVNHDFFGGRGFVELRTLPHGSPAR